MQYVPSFPSPVAPDADTSLPGPVTAIAAVRPVSPRPAAQLARNNVREFPRQPVEERRTPPAEPIEAERRKVCRRIYNTPVLQELRSGRDRRHRNQRRGDLRTAVDEQI